MIFQLVFRIKFDQESKLRCAEVEWVVERAAEGVVCSEVWEAVQELN